jgi:hypothetical protein
VSFRVTTGASDLVRLVDVDIFGDRVHPGPGAAIVVLVAFLVSFLAIRTSARLTRSVSWWPGGVQSGGVHLHHLVWGICLMILCGFLAFATPLDAPWWHFVAIGFGVGAGFAIDEFALWVRLEDVYWRDEGRSSLDAAVCSFAFGGLVVLGVRPFGLDETSSVWATVAAVAIVLSLAVVCFAKGRIVLGIFGLFIPLVAVVAAARLARPSSPWAHWRYHDDKLTRSRERFAATRLLARAQRRLGELVAGAPSDEP